MVRASVFTASGAAHCPLSVSTMKPRGASPLVTTSPSNLSTASLPFISQLLRAGALSVMSLKP